MPQGAPWGGVMREGTGEAALVATGASMVETTHAATSRSCRRAPGVIARVAAALAVTLAVGVDAAVSTAAAQSGQVVSVGQGDALQRVDLGLNKSLVIDLPQDAFDILVANPAVADAVTRSSRRIYLFGRQVGETNIFVFGENGEPIANLDLRVERDVGTLESDLARYIPGSNIEVEIVNDNVVLSGEVLTPQDASRATQLASAFLNGGQLGTGSNDPLAVIFGDDESSVINLITVLGENQVTLKLTVAEVQRSVLKQLGVTFDGNVNASVLNGSNFNLNDLTGGTQSSQTAMGLSGLNGNSFSFGAQLGGDDLGIGFDATLRLLNQTGVMRTLAEPTLTAVSGQEARFAVGGQYQILGGIDVEPAETEVLPDGSVLRRPSTTTLESRDVSYGVSMAFRPVVLSSGRISIALSTRVSEPTAAGSQPVANGTFLSLRTREASTTVEMPSGGSFMIAGLIRDDVRQTIAKTPGLSSVPILGSLFRSRAFTRDETELVIIATPYLVRPVARTELQRPDDNFQPENDTKSLLLGRVNRIYGNRNKPSGPYHGNIGFIYK